MSDFDDLFKSRFEEHQASVPDDMWSRIQSAQAEDDVKRYGFYYKTLGTITILGVLLFAGIFYFSNTQEGSYSSIKTMEDIEKPSIFSEYLKSEKAGSFGVLEAKQDVNIPDLDVSVLNTSTFSSNVISDTKQDDTFDTNSETISKSNELRNVQFFKNESFVDFTSSKAKANEDIRKENPNYNTNLLKGVFRRNLISENKNIFNALPEYDKKCPKFGRKSFHGYFSVEAYHSSDVTFRNFDTDNEEFNDFIDLRSSTETSTYSYSNGLRLKWHNSSGFGLGLGIDRNVINERFSFVDNDAREVRVVISIDTLFNQDGTFETFSDTTRVELQGTKTNLINNSYTSIDIPFHISYQKEFGRWAVGISGGIYVNLLFNQRGRILDFDQSPAWITKGPTNELDIYRTTSGVKFDASLTLIYHITPNIDLMAEPYFRYNPNSLTRVNHPLSHFYNTAGLRTGLRYNFGF